MNIAIRADASITTGTGHIMRCLTLASHLPKNARITFLCKRMPGHLGEKILQQGFRLILADIPDGISQQHEAQLWCELLTESELSLLIVDHYALGAAFCGVMRRLSQHIMVIDDLANRLHDCDILLDQNYYSAPEHRYKSLVPAHCKNLLGPKFALLRDEFNQQLATRMPNHLLISFGGSDKQNLTAQCAALLPSLSNYNITADVVIGASYPFSRELQLQIAQYKGVILHENCHYMSELMQKASLMIGSGGSTHWERCRVGLPGLVITTADNQTEITKELAKAGACEWLGAYEQFSPDLLIQKILFYFQHPDALLALSRQARNIVPPDSGVNKVIEHLNHLHGEKL